MALNSNQLRKAIPIIEQNIKKLDKQYSDFFDGVTSQEPKNLRAQVENSLSQWRGKPIPNTMLRFKFQNLVQRYNVHREKWERLLRIKLKNEQVDNF